MIKNESALIRQVRFFVKLIKLTFRLKQHQNNFPKTTYNVYLWHEY